jgi:hypothetical protein
LAVSGIVSLPWSPLASLPLRLGFAALPVVGELKGLAELAAGSPVTEPLPLGISDCALATATQSTKAALREMTADFMKVPFDQSRCNSWCNSCALTEANWRILSKFLIPSTLPTSRPVYAIIFDRRPQHNGPFGTNRWRPTQRTAFERLEGDLLGEHHVESNAYPCPQ